MSDLGSPAQQNPTQAPAPVPSSASRSQAPAPTSRGQIYGAPSPLPAKAAKPASPPKVNVASGTLTKSPDNPAPLTATGLTAPAAQPEVSPQPAPTQEAKAIVAPAPVAPAKPPVAPALATTNKIAPPAPQREVIVAQATTAVKSSAPVAPAALKSEAVVAPAPFAKVPPDCIAPVSHCQNLLCFEDMEAIARAITKAKDRAKQSQDNLEELLVQNRNTDDGPAGEEKRKLIWKYQPGPQFAWSRVGEGPAISVSFAELSSLKDTVFEGYERNFDIEENLLAAVAQFPAKGSAELSRQVNTLIADHAAEGDPAIMQLEGLWIEFPLVTQEEAETDTASQSPNFGPKLEITVSILPSWSTNLGPFSVDRIQLKFGDIQRDLHPQSKNSASET